MMSSDKRKVSNFFHTKRKSATYRSTGQSAENTGEWNR